MATACDSDTDIAVDVLQMSCIAVPIGEAGAAAKISLAADTTSVVSTGDATVLCIEGLHPKTWCCNGFSNDKRTNNHEKDNSLISGTHSPIDTIPVVDHMSLMVPLLSEYYNYIEVIQEELSTRSDTSFDQLRLSIQYLPCFTKKLNKHCIFNQSTPISLSTNLTELISNIKDISSWYNHGLITHIAKLHLNNRELVERYTHTVSANCNDILLVLPTVSTGPSCPKTFEELKMYTRGQPDTYTLGEVTRLHDSLGDIIGLKPLVVLFQGISNAKVGSVFLFWIPSTLGSFALSNAASSVNKMTESGIVQIEGVYNTVISAPFNNESDIYNMKSSTVQTRYTTDSGYETNFYSTSELDNDHSRSTILDDIKSDEVFLTAVSPDSSTNSTRYSLDVSHHSDEASDVSVSVRQCSTPVIEPPPGYTGSSNNCTQDVSPIDRPVLTASEPEQKPTTDEVIDKSDEESNYISMSSAPTIKLIPTQQHTSIKSTEAEIVSPSHTASDVPLSPFLQPTAVVYHRAHSESSYRILSTSEDCGFVKRVLLRASEDFPANLQVVSIGYQQESLIDDLIRVETGERLTAHYLEGDFIKVSNSTCNTGYLPYSMCRISLAYYGKKSKSFQLAHTHLYSISTVNVQEIVDTSDGFREFNTLRVDLVVIRGYTAHEKDEMSVSIGENVRVLYSDNNWVYGTIGNTGRIGFIPRSNCRLTRQSYRTLNTCGWLHNRHPFQSDFIFNMSLAPPRFLLDNPRLITGSNLKSIGQIRMITRNYIVPGTQYIIKRGASVKTVYSEGNMFRYVATISGNSFWIPSAYTIASPAVPVLPFDLTVTRDNLNTTNVQQPTNTHPHTQQAVTLRRSRAQTLGAYDTAKLPKKKVSFAEQTQMAIINSVRSSLCQSNPELSLLDNVDTSENDPTYAVIPARRVKSNENFFDLMLSDNSPTTSFCGKFFCF